jgi:tRNA_anti-like
MDRRLRYGTIVLIALIAGLFTYAISVRSCVPHQPAAKADLAISACDLTRAFDRNESFSDSLYLHKALFVSGVIRAVQQTESGAYTATMGGAVPGGTEVVCRLDSRFNTRYATLKAGDSLQLLGVCAGRLGDVVMIQCVVEK